MVASAPLLKPTEAAIVAGVSLRDVNRTIDEGILPPDFVDNEDGRRVAPAACLLIAFFVSSKSRLSAKERRFVLNAVSARLRKGNVHNFPSPANEDWTVKHEFLAVDLMPFIRAIGERWERLSAAEEMVVSSPYILNGTPVIKGTRVPVYDVAASAAAGIGTNRVLDDYPSLTGKQVDLAVLYAAANPPRGRPRGPPSVPVGARIISHRRLARRKAE